MKFSYFNSQVIEYLNFGFYGLFAGAHKKYFIASNFKFYNSVEQSYLPSASSGFSCLNMI